MFYPDFPLFDHCKFPFIAAPCLCRMRKYDQLFSDSDIFLFPFENHFGSQVFLPGIIPFVHQIPDLTAFFLSELAYVRSADFRHLPDEKRISPALNVSVFYI